jgi:hypothetical protein
MQDENKLACLSMENLEAFGDKVRRLPFEWSTWVGSIDILVISSNFHTNLLPLSDLLKTFVKMSYSLPELLPLFPLINRLHSAH